MLTFATVPLSIAEERNVMERVQGFAQTYIFLDELKAKQQADRCIQCGTHPCSSGLSIVMTGCPLENNIKDWLKLTAKGDLKGAFQRSVQTNPMNRVINAALCPVTKLCAGACISETSGHGAISMGYVEQHIAELGWQSGWMKPITAPTEREESVAIIGSGPAGYGAAITLRKLGYRVTMFERNEVPGGLLTLGIPNFKIEKDKVLPLYDYLAANGVDIRCNSEIGGNVSYEKVLEEFDAVIHATGAQVTRNPGLRNGGDSLLVPALDALITRNRIDLQELADSGFKSRFLDGYKFAGDEKGLLDVSGRRVAVLGGGDTSIDLVRTWRRYNPESVTLIYRGTEQALRASPKEVKAAKGEEVLFTFGTEAKEISGTNVTMKGPHGEFGFDADRVGSAIGFTAENPNERFGVEGLPLNGGNTLQVRPVAATKKLNGTGSGLSAVYNGKDGPTLVFSAGDAVRGPSLAVLAERDGIDVARSVHIALSGAQRLIDDHPDLATLKFA